MPIETTNEDIDSGNFKLFEDKADTSAAPASIDAGIDKHIKDAIGESSGKAEDASNADTKGGAKDEAGKTGEAAKSDSDSSTKDGTGKQPSDGKTKEEAGKAGAAGDLKLPDGTVVKAGPERRFYEQLQVRNQETADLRNTVNQLRDSSARVRQDFQSLQDTIKTTHGVDARTVATGVKMFKDFQTDPVGTARKVLTELVSAGYTLEGIAQGIDVNAIEQRVQARLEQQYGPLREQAQTQQSEAEINREIEQQLTGFYNAYPDARIHDDVIANVISKNPRMPLSEAYFQLKGACAERGLDWSKPLAPQIAASGEQQQQQPQQKSLPNGRNDTAVGIGDKSAKTVVAHESTDSKDIVKAAMREAGLNI